MGCSGAARPVVVQNGALLVVYLLRLFIAEQQDNAAEQEDGRAPADAVRPAELPDRPVT